MGYVTLGVLVLTGVALLFGTLFGLIRGSRRALLRLILVIISAVGAILLRGVLVNFVINLHIGEDGTPALFEEASSTKSLQFLISSS